MEAGLEGLWKRVRTSRVLCCEKRPLAAEVVVKERVGCATVRNILEKNGFMGLMFMVMVFGRCAGRREGNDQVDGVCIQF